MTQTGMKVEFSDPLINFDIISDHKLSYERDNRVILPESSYRWKGLLPQFRGYLDVNLNVCTSYMLESPF